MTFFEFALERLFGPPLRAKGRGESYWPCPWCGSEKFHSMPEKKGEKDRTRCWRCGEGGDLIDMMLVAKVGTHKECLALMYEWHEEYSPLFPPGTGTDERPPAERAYDAMTPAERKTLHDAWVIATRCQQKHGVWIGSLAPYCYFSFRHANAATKKPNTQRSK